MNIIGEMHHFDLFSSLEDHQIEEILSLLSGRIECYEKNEIVFNQGETVHEIGLVLEGELIGISYDLLGHSNIYAHIDTYDYFGESYALIHHDLKLDVMAVTKTRVLFLDGNKIMDVHYPAFIKNLMHLLASKNVALSNKINTIAPKSMRERLMNYLYMQIKIHDNFVFDIPFNRQQLADYLLVDRSSLSHELSLMKQEGLLDFKKNHFIIYKDVFFKTSL
jgi:CRP-like cAMP-binding protein